MLGELTAKTVSKRGGEKRKSYPYMELTLMKKREKEVPTPLKEQSDYLGGKGLQSASCSGWGGKKER